MHSGTLSKVEPPPIEPSSQGEGFPLASEAAGSRPSLRIAATFTVEPLEESLRFWAEHLELPLDLGFAPYNQIFQQLLDPSSLLGSNRHGLNVVLIRLEDLAATGPRAGTAMADGDGALEAAEANLCELLSAVKGALTRSPVPWLVVVCPASKEALADRSRANVLERLEQLVAAELTERMGLSLLLPAELLRLYPALDYDDPQANRLGHVPFTPAGYAALATLIFRKAHALSRPPRKVIAVDCDQTLWAGVCGEDGPQGVKVDPARQSLQQFLVRQAESGMLLCLCSKNNEPEVVEVFRQQPGMPLGPKHLAAQRINWRPKSENLQSLARELNLGLDSFILLDDSPMECAEVEARCPEVIVLALPEETSHWSGFLEHVWAFDHTRATDEDRQRTARYRENRLREQLQASAPSLKSFLDSLQLRIQIEPARSEHLPRLSQLTHRTNQFNTSSRRRSEQELAALQRDPSWGLLAVTVSDRFGEYGLVGAAFFERLPGALRVDTFLLSCRVLGKGVEHRMLAHLGQLGRELGAARVDVPLVPSGRNQPAQDFLERVGAAFQSGENGGSMFRFPAEVAAAVCFEPEERLAASAPATASARPLMAMPSAASGVRTAPYAWIARTAADPEQILRLIEGRGSLSSSEPPGEHVPAQTEVQRRLCALWQEVLKLQRVGIRDDFFELGGTSQLAVRLCARIERQLGRKLPLVALFKGPTIEQLAAELQRGAATPKGH